MKELMPQVNRLPGACGLCSRVIREIVNWPSGYLVDTIAELNHLAYQQFNPTKGV